MSLRHLFTSAKLIQSEAQDSGQSVSGYLAQPATSGATVLTAAILALLTYAQTGWETSK